MENKRVEEYSTSRPPQTGKIWKDFSHLWNGWCQSTENAELILFQKKLTLEFLSQKYLSSPWIITLE